MPHQSIKEDTPPLRNNFNFYKHSYTLFITGYIRMRSCISFWQFSFDRLCVVIRFDDKDVGVVSPYYHAVCFLHRVVTFHTLFYFAKFSHFL